ncbi:MAG: hypothetical protein R3C39_08725 [Dehalococcoidia bacterium]
MLVRPASNDDLEALNNLARRTYVEAFGASMSSSDLEAHLEATLSRGAVESMLKGDVILTGNHATYPSGGTDCD